jgi:DNA-binding Lrp family transcriptional regulator
MIKAYVLVVSNPGTTKSVYAALRQVQGVVECHEVMGPYDIVVEIEAEELADVPQILGDKIRTIPGVESTTSLVTFPEAGSGHAGQT